MPSPFPGMDPFLKHPDIFPDFHDRFFPYLGELLQASLPPPYFQAIGRRAWIEISERYVEPDVTVLRSRGDPPAGGESAGGTVVATRTGAQPVVIHVPHDEVQEAFLEIYVGRGKDKRLVTTIEVLSLANKTPGEHGRDLCVRKQREVLGSKVHLVEVDLLRAGEHTTAVPKDRLLAKAGPFDYHVCIHRFDNLEDYFVHPIRLEDHLPEIAVPLLPGDGAVKVNLQAVFDRCYAAGPYRAEIDYTADPIIPPLSPERTEWAGRLVQEAMARKG